MIEHVGYAKQMSFLAQGAKAARDAPEEEWNKRAAKELLAKEDAQLLPVVVASLTLLGTEIATWEPESIWLEYKDKAGGELPPINREKILASLAMTLNPVFFWDHRAFKNIVSVANGEPSQPDTLQEPTPAELLWGAAIGEAVWKSVHSEAPPWGDEIQRFAAVVLFRGGLQVAPTPLAWCQDHLDMLFRNSQGPSQDKLEAEWSKLDQSRLPDHKFEETPVDVQLHTLATMFLYAQSQATQTANQLLKLRNDHSR